MKKLTLTLCGLAIAVSSIAQQLALNTVSHEEKSSAVFEWTSTSHDFGKIKVGVPVTYEFSFVNKGTGMLVISSVQASCGCTVASYTKEPIAAGEKGFVKATYNAAKVGQFTKTITVNANAEDAPIQLTIKGEVVESTTTR